MRTVCPLLLFVAVVNTGGAQSAPPRVIELPAPNATLAAEFTRVSSVRELADGRLLIADFGEKKVVAADWARGAVAPVGRNGSGPAEYLQPSSLLRLAGDSSLLLDPQNGRWLLLHGSSIVTTVGPEAPGIMSGARLPIGADDQGHVIFTRGIGAGARGGATAMPRLDSVRLLRAGRATGRVDTIAMLRARKSKITVEGPAEKPTRIEVFTHPLAFGELAALFPDGWIAVARIEPYRIDWIAPDGRLVSGPSLPFERVRLDGREQHAFAERFAERSGGKPRDPRSFPDWPDIMPPFVLESLLPSTDGRLWIRRPATAANPWPPYDVIDRRGALVARVSAGKGVQVVGFGRAAVYTVAIDDNGIQEMQRRPFPRF